MSYKIIASILFCTLFFGISVQAQNIFVDEEYSDWDSISSLYDDPVDDDGFSELDFLTFKMSNDNRFLYFYLELADEIDLMEDNSITMYIDTDNDPQTGISYKGIGYEMEYTFGERNGVISDGEIEVGPYDLGLISAPTITSKRFEVVMEIYKTFNYQPLFPGSTISIVLVNEINDGDQIPNEGEVLNYTFNNDVEYSPKRYEFKKPSSADIRVITYNTRGNNLFDEELSERYARVLTALDPDLIAFQEVFGNGSSAFVDRMEELVPSSEGEQWYAIDVGNDNVLASRFPITHAESVAGNAAYMVDYAGQDIFIIAAHPPCCNNENGRQNEIDAFMAYLRDNREGDDKLIESFTPIIIMGDMNLVGLKRQQTTLLTGDIDDNDTYGEDFAPDWDGTSLEDAKPITVELPNVFTWYREASSFGAGRLDYITYSGSVLELENSFSFHSKHSEFDLQTTYGFDPDDTLFMSDHVPVVADFSINIQVSNEEDQDEIPDGISLLQNYPNPFNPSTNIEFELKTAQQIQLIVYDISGQMVDLIFTGQKSAGIHQIQWDATNYSSGIYFYQLKTESGSITKKMILLK